MGVSAAQSVLTKGHPPSMSRIWRRTCITAGIGLVATVVWGGLTGHGLGGGGLLPNVTPFNPTWRATVAIVVLGAGVFFAIPIAWLVARKDTPVLADVYLATVVLLLTGTVAWARGSPSSTRSTSSSAGSRSLPSPWLQWPFGPFLVSPEGPALEVGRQRCAPDRHSGRPRYRVQRASTRGRWVA